MVGYNNPTMTIKRLTRFLPLTLLLIGAGCVPMTSSKVAAPMPAAVAPAPQPEPSAVDPYEGWGEIQPGGVVSLRIPPNCKVDPGAGSTYVTCQREWEDPLPEFVVSSDGVQVNIRRWEGLEVAHWDEIIASLRVLTPLRSEVQITIEK